MTLIQRSISGGVMVLILLLLRRFTLNKLPKWSFVLMEDIILLRLLCPLSVSSIFSVYGLIRNTFPITQSASQRMVSLLPVEQIAPAKLTKIETAASPTVAQTAFSPVDALPYLWLIGAGLLGVYLILSYLRCYRRFSLSLPAKSADIDLWMQAHPLIRHYSVRISQEITSPMTYGVFSPVILLPKGLDESALDYVLTHEWTHIKHWDTLRKLVMALTLCVHWFNPLVWVLYGQMNRDIELTCDEGVLNHFTVDNRKHYALTLLELEERQMEMIPLCNGFSKNVMEERIKAIMKNRKPTVLFSLLGVALAVIVAVCFATTGKLGTDTPPVSSTISIADAFLTSIYTADYEGRFTKLQEVRDAPSSDGMEAAVTEYMSGVAGMVTPELLEKLTANRIPYKYDANAEENPWFVNGVGITGDEESGQFEFIVNIMNAEGQSLTPMTGQIDVDPQTLLVTRFWEGAISSQFGTMDTDTDDSSTTAVSHSPLMIISAKGHNFGGASATREVITSSHSIRFELEENHPYYQISAEALDKASETQIKYSVTDSEGNEYTYGLFSTAMSCLGDMASGYEEGIYTLTLETLDGSPLNLNVTVAVDSVPFTEDNSTYAGAVENK